MGPQMLLQTFSPPAWRAEQVVSPPPSSQHNAFSAEHRVQPQSLLDAMAPVLAPARPSARRLIGLHWVLRRDQRHRRRPVRLGRITSRARKSIDRPRFGLTSGHSSGFFQPSSRVRSGNRTVPAGGIHRAIAHRSRHCRLGSPSPVSVVFDCIVVRNKIRSFRQAPRAN